MKKQYLHGVIKKAEDGNLTIVASDETLDRYGEVVPLDAWDLRNYKKNPVLLVDHEYLVSNIVGRAKNLKVTDNALVFEPEFHELTQLSQEVKKMVESDFAPAVSVGFLPHGPKKDGDKGSNELLEISFVAVGANPNALALAMKSVKPEEEEKVKEWVEENKQAEIIDFEINSKERTITTVFDNNTKIVNPITEKFLERLTYLYDLELKEGRVLSGKNRTLIENCSSALKQAGALLEELLQATEPNKGKEPEKQVGRKPEVEQVLIAPKKAKSAVVRALQDINTLSKNVLTELKGDAQS